MNDKCQCIFCERDGTHASDCAVHNAPAKRPGACNCGAVRGNLLREFNEILNSREVEWRG